MARLGEPPDRPWSTRRVRERIRALGWSHVDMQCAVAQQRDDGYIGRDEALECCDGEQWILEALSTSVRGKQPMLHQPGQRCPERNCIDSSPPWRQGFEYRLCSYLKRNPSKAEKSRKDSQDADRRDPVLKARVLERDGAWCRYCRSGPLSSKAVRAHERRKVLQLDHPDPDRAAGQDASNYVVACASCNEFKGARTPFEAGMELLPSATAAERVEWTARGLTLFERPSIDPPVNPAITIRINDGSTTDQRHDDDPLSDPVVDPDVDPITSSAAEARPETAPDLPDHHQDQAGKGSGSGRVGLPGGGDPGAFLDAAGQPARSPDAPDIWTRRSRAPVDPRAGPP